MILAENPNFPSLYYKHGLMIFLYLGMKLFGFSIMGSLLLAATCSCINIIIFLLLCMQVMSQKYAFAATSIFTFNYYIFFYHSSNMSDGYALMFFSIALLIFIKTMKKISSYAQ
jgi:4-amino-4-deoxy-L-arabinose transferase-like glycosyltransferase